MKLDYVIDKSSIGNVSIPQHAKLDSVKDTNPHQVRFPLKIFRFVFKYGMIWQSLSTFRLHIHEHIFNSVTFLAPTGIYKRLYRAFSF
jgi:hypothetical protein